MLPHRKETATPQTRCGRRLSKKVFDNLVDGGASSPATTTPTSFCLNCKQFRSQKLQSCDFSSRKISTVVAVHAADHD